jgi:hypothetical protein
LELHEPNPSYVFVAAHSRIVDSSPGSPHATAVPPSVVVVEKMGRVDTWKVAVAVPLDVPMVASGMADSERVDPDVCSAAEFRQSSSVVIQRERSAQGVPATRQMKELVPPHWLGPTLTLSVLAGDWTVT